jgi:hypothetical protein
MSTGVRYAEPPADAIPSIKASIEKAIEAANLPPGAKGTIVGIADEKGANGAVVIRAGRGWDVVSWIGKEWGAPKPHYGAAVRKVW